MTEHIEPGKVRSFEESRQIPLLKTSPPTSASSENSLKEAKKTEETAVDPDQSVPPPASDDVYPGDHGDKRAILISVGVFFALFVGFGILNIPGTFQTYWVNNQLKEYSQSTVSWIAAMQFFLTLFGSVFTGRWFDLHGGRGVLFVGSIVFCFAFFMVSLCTEYYQFFLAYGILMGLTASMIFIPAVGTTAQWYYHHRGLASGLTFASGSIAGIVLPIAMRRLFESVGFPWTVRIVGFINLFALIIGNLLIRPRIKPSKSRTGKVIDLSAIKDVRFALLGIGIFFSDWALFGPITFITSYALSQGIDPNLAYYMIAFLNVGSSLGRVIPGLLADKIGPFNVMIMCTASTAIFAFGLWLPTSSAAATIAYSIIFGFTSGGYISLMPVLVGRISELREFGTRYGTVLVFASCASLTGVPIGGALIGRGDNYLGLIIWTGVTNVLASFFFCLARWKVGGKSVLKFV